MPAPYVLPPQLRPDGWLWIPIAVHRGEYLRISPDGVVEPSPTIAWWDADTLTRVLTVAGVIPR